MKAIIILAALAVSAHGRVLDGRSLLEHKGSLCEGAAISCDPCWDLQKQQCLANQLCKYSATSDRNPAKIACKSWPAIKRVTIEDGDEKGGILRARLQALGCHQFYSQEDCRVARLNGVNGGSCWWHDCGTEANGGIAYCGEDRDAVGCNRGGCNLCEESLWEIDSHWTSNNLIEITEGSDGSIKTEYNMQDFDWEDTDKVPMPYLKTPVTIPVTLKWDTTFGRGCPDYMIGLFHTTGAYGPQWGGADPDVRGAMWQNGCLNWYLWSTDGAGNDYQAADWGDYFLNWDDHPWVGVDDGADEALMEYTATFTATGGTLSLKMSGSIELNWSAEQTYGDRNPFSDGDSVYLHIANDGDWDYVGGVDYGSDGDDNTVEFRNFRLVGQ